MAELSYQKIRSANQAREADEVRTDTRRKNLLLLVMHYLNEEGFAQSANSLSKETNLDFNKFEVCDNVDLETIIMEYESYYYIKFQRYPKITKKLHEDVKQQYRMNGKLKNSNRSSSTPSLPRISYTNQTAVANPPAAPPSNSARPKSGNVRRQTSQRTATDDPKRKEPLSSLGEEAASLLQQHQGQTQAQLNGNINNNANPASAFENENHGLQGLVIHGRQDQNAHEPRKPKAGQIIDYRSMLNQETRITVEEDSRVFDPQERLIKPLGNFLGYNGEWRELAMTISRDIYTQNPNVRWDDIIGLDTAKRLVKESVVYPIRYPQLFTGILSPWKGLLLYGPPGTGKTLLAKAVATECNTTFFNVSASTIVSKWRGDSEKLVRVLFELARFHAPSTIFLDELESIMSQRGSQGSGQEHEGSRRMKTELLVQMDGLAKSDDLVFLLAASNLPWELDYAMLRRLEKRIIVGLPSPEARRQMFFNFLPPKVRSDPGSLELTCNIDYDYCAEKTEGYSGSDIKLVCKEAAMRVVRKIFDALENSTENDELHIKLDPLTTADVEAALKTTKPSARGLADKYAAWQKEYESV